MSGALLDSLARGLDGRQADPSRRALLDAALRDGLPGPRSEAWKYTPLRALERRRFAPAAVDAADFASAHLHDVPAPRVVFVNGRHSAALSDLRALPAGVGLEPDAAPMRGAAGSDASPRGGDDVFARLNAALAETGVALQADANATAADAAVHLVFVGTAAREDAAWHLRHRVVLAEGARLMLVEHHLGGEPHRHLDTMHVALDLGAGARLVHARVQRSAEGATSLLRTDAVLAADAAYERIDLELGAALARHELNVRLAGDRARLRAHGVLLAGGKRHLDTRLGIEHVARDTACELTWRGIGAGRGRAVFHGGITIHPGADGADASLSNKNLLLSDSAEIDTQPVLVIHADEVKAAHGATVGQLDPAAMFYLRSRGLQEADARRLLTAAFVRAPVTAVADAALRDWLLAQLDDALAAVIA